MHSSSPQEIAGVFSFTSRPIGLICNVVCDVPGFKSRKATASVMASSAGSTARRRKLGQLCAWGRVFAIKGLLAYLTVAKADFRSTCEASAGQVRAWAAKNP